MLHITIDNSTPQTAHLRDGYYTICSQQPINYKAEKKVWQRGFWKLQTFPTLHWLIEGCGYCCWRATHNTKLEITDYFFNIIADRLK